jgi:RNA polymerase-associated protein LEO1
MSCRIRLLTILSAPRRELDDRDLDSGDDDGRLDRRGNEAVEEEQEMQEQEKIVMDLDLPRQAGPEPSDGEVCKSGLSLLITILT